MPLGAVAARIEPELADDGGPVTGEVVDAAQVGAVGWLVFQIDVAGGEVGVAGFEVFAARIVAVGEQAVRPDAAAGADQAFERLADARRTHPAGEVGRHLVGHEQTRQRRVPTPLRQPVDQVALRLGQGPRVAQEIGAKRPPQPREYPQSRVGRRVEQCRGRKLIEPQGVAPDGADPPEIGRGIGRPAARERPVRDHPQKQPPGARAQEFPVGAERGGSVHRRQPTTASAGSASLR